MYERLPVKDEPDAFGLSRKDYAHEVLEVWPENWPCMVLFSDLQTQWRSAGMGLIGLDYNVLFAKMDRMTLTASEYDELEADIRTMEHAALVAMNEKND